MTTHLLTRFLGYTKIHTTSDEGSTTHPSSTGQLDLARELEKECISIGLRDVSLDSNGYLMATLPSNMDTPISTIGFVAHLDTSPDFSGENVNPQIVKNYDGQDIVLNPELNIILSPKDFPYLKELVGETLITTDGTTLLGADDKAGIAEIMTAMAYLIANPTIKHGPIRICFTPDEEIGQGADLFDVEKFGALFAYTVDGGTIGHLEAENFNAAGAVVTIKGRNVHPGDAKNKMINSILIANEFIRLLPHNEVPEHTEGYEGFYHLNDINGDVEETNLNYIIRDFDTISFKNRKALMSECVDTINTKFGENTASITMKDQYYNMDKILKEYTHITDLAKEAMTSIGIIPVVAPIRGGTDGSRLSFMGLPCPNLFTGGHNYHGRFEFAVLSHMEKSVETIVKIIALHAQS